jgi:hypothetical protein
MRSPNGSPVFINAIQKPDPIILNRLAVYPANPQKPIQKNGLRFFSSTAKPKNGMEPMFHRILAENVGRENVGNNVGIVISKGYYYKMPTFLHS